MAFLPHPLSGKMSLDLPGGTKVRIYMHDGEIQDGTVFKNPKYEGGQSIRLMNATRLGCTAPMPGVQFFTRKNIFKVEVIEEGKRAAKQKVEYQLKTFVVTTTGQFKQLVNSLAFGVTEVGMKFFGENYGRFSSVYWILLCTRDTIIPINVKALLAENCAVWEELRQALFENPRIVKIIHNSRLESDFLYHSPATQCIKLENVFDTQICSFYFLKRDEIEFVEAMKGNPGLALQKPPPKVEVESLSTILKRYVGDSFHGREHLLMEEMEDMNICKNSPYALQPMPDGKTLKYMALTVKHLVHLRQALLDEFMTGYKKCVSVATDMMISLELGDAAVTLIHEEKCVPGVAAKVKENAALYSTGNGKLLRTSSAKPLRSESNHDSAEDYEFAE